MDFTKMRDIFEPHIAHIREQIYLDQQLAILHGNAQVFKLMFQHHPPFVINDHRLGIVTRGTAEINVNLVEKTISANMLVFLGPGSIISPIHFSPDLEIYGFGLSTDFPLPFAPGQLPAAFNGQLRDFQLPVNEYDITIARNIIETLWHLVHQKDYNHQTASSLVAAQMHHYNGLYQQYCNQTRHAQTREQTIFNRFIDLVNQYAQHEHQIAFYASKMCLTERYLGTVIRQSSGVTAKEWIDRAIISHIKVELRHTDKTVAQISEEMNFPNLSFFCKYFKRLTQITPAEFRQNIK